MNNGISSLKLLKQCFMDFRLSCTSPLPWVWVIEALAHTDQVDLCLLLSKHGGDFYLLLKFLQWFWLFVIERP